MTAGDWSTNGDWSLNGDWVAGPDSTIFRVQVALSGSSQDGLWDESLWDDANWSGTVPEWDTLPAWLGVEISYGRDRFLDRVRAASCRVIAPNTDGDLNPYVGTFAGLDLRPGRLLRVQGNAGGAGWVDLFTGFIWALDEGYGPAGANPVTYFDCLGQLAALAGFSPPAVTPTVGGSERTNQRITRVLEAWETRETITTDFQTGAHTMPATDMAGGLLQLAQAAAAAEGGGAGFWFNRSAVPTFRKRDWLSTDTRSLNVQSSPGGASANAPQIIAADPSWSTAQIINDVQLTRPGGSTVIRREAEDSELLYGPRTWTAALDVETDAQLIAVADRILTGYQYDRLRLDRVTLWAPTVTAAAEMLALELGDLVQAKVSTLEDWSYTIDAHVAGIGYSITGSDWSMTLRLDDSARTAP